MSKGDILSVTINRTTNPSLDCDGWTANVEIEGFSPGGVYNWGLGIDNDPANATVVFTVVSEGYDDTGTLGTITRTIYGVKTLRKPSPNQTVLEENTGANPSADNLVITIALSDFIYTDDRNGGLPGENPSGSGTSGVDPTVSIAEGWYINIGDLSEKNNAVTDLPITINYSTLDYPRVIGNWAWPGFERITGNFNVECVAFHRFAQDAKPVACVKFSAYDESGNTVPVQTVTDLVISNKGDPTSVLVYSATIPVDNLTQGEVITVNFAAYPWVGDGNSVLDTSDGVNTAPSALYTSLTFLCDKAETFGTTVAYVDGVGGGSPAANDIANDATARANPFDTISAAINGIVSYNNVNYARANSEAGIIYLEEGNHDWTGAVNTPGANAKTWLTITKASDASRSNVIIAGEANDEDAGARVKIENITVEVDSSVTILFNSMEQFWVHNCIINYEGVLFNRGADPSFTYYTLNTIAQLKYGFKNWPLVNNSINLLRGNTMSVQYLSLAFTTLGNVGFIRVISDHSQPIPILDNIIFAYNKVKVDNNVMLNINTTANFSWEHGFALIQNTIERTTAGPNTVATIGTGTSSGSKNFLIWYNTIVGQRCNWAYNDIGSDPVFYLNWSVKNNILSDYNLKGDIYAPANGNRIGNWANTYGVGFESNFFRDQTINQTEFEGLYVKQTLAITSIFVDDASAEGSDLGDGDYNLVSSASDAIGRSVKLLLPYDIEGNTRFIETATNGGASGAYEFGTPVSPSAPSATVPITITNVSDALLLTSPIIRITGNRIINDSIVSYSNRNIQREIIQTGNIFNNKDILVFLRSVIITLTSSYPLKTYSAVTTSIKHRIFVGKPFFNDDSTKLAEIRYTINGKKPGLSSKIYKNPLVFKQNTAGSDGVILKYVVYYKGKKSVVTTIKFIISKKKNTNIYEFDELQN